MVGVIGPLLFMVIERFRGGSASEVNDRLEREGRLAPEGVPYWEGLVEVEVVPVGSGRGETTEVLAAPSE